MDHENSTNGSISSPEKVKEYFNPESGDGQLNGVNGYNNKETERSENKVKSSSSSSHKSDHKDKHRDKDRDRDKSKSSSHKSSSSSKDKDKERHSSSSKDRHSSSHKSSRSDKDRDKHRDKDKDKHRDEKKSSSSSKDKGDKEHKSSSSSSLKEKDKDKDKESRDKNRKEKDKEREKDKDKHKHSSSSKDKDRSDKHSSSSSSKDKHRSKDKDRHHSSSRDKDKDRKSEKRSSDEVKKSKSDHKSQAPPPVAESPRDDSVDEDDNKLVIKEENETQESETDIKNISTASLDSCDFNLSQFNKNESQFSLKDEQPEEEPEEQQEEQHGQQNEDSDEDLPLMKKHSYRKSAARIQDHSAKRKMISDDDDDEDDEDDLPLVARKKPKKEKKEKEKPAKNKKKRPASDDEEEWDKPKKESKKSKKEKAAVKTTPVVEKGKKGGRKKKEEEEGEVWKWWEEKKTDATIKWKFLEHKGPVFAPPYEPLPESVKFYYDGKEIRLSQDAEEVAGFYAKMLDHDYTTKDIFNNNFFKDWRKMMSDKEKAKITDLKKCNFKSMHAYFMDQSERNRNRTKEEKLALKEKNEALLKEYGFCTIDGHKEKIGNFKIEPPGLFRGRGEHPKMGMLKRRVEAEDIIINCSADSVAPKAPPGHRWREVRHDPKVTWLASWTENVQSQVKYIMLNPSSKLKGEKDWQKYETARRLHKSIDKIRSEYHDGWKSKEMRIRQRAVALYFIDKLALRAGNEKDEDQADTVGCCSLRVEHIELHEEKSGKEYVVVFDFLGKDSIRYYNEVPVEKRVFKNLQLFMENKAPGDDLFDRLNTAIMNKHLNELMEGLTAKVFRTYNASWTLQQQLDKLTNEDDSVAEKILSYNRANRAVAILCNHQRSVPKGHEKSMEKLKEKIDTKKEAIRDAERQVKDAHSASKRGSVKEKTVYELKKKTLQRLKEQLTKLEIQETDRDENKTIALGTSKLNYLDPRISVAWCKKYDVPIEKIYNKTQRDKFRWAIDMAGPDYVF